LVTSIGPLCLKGFCLSINVLPSHIYIYTSVDPIQFLDGVLLVKLPARPGQHVAITIVFRILLRFRFKFIQVRAWPGSVSEERGGFGRSVWLLRRLWTLLGSLFSLLGHPWEVFGSHGRPIEALRRSLGVPGNPWRGSSWSLGGPEWSLGGPETSMGGHWDPRGSPGVPSGVPGKSLLASLEGPWGVPEVFKGLLKSLQNHFFYMILLILGAHNSPPETNFFIMIFLKRT